MAITQDELQGIVSAVLSSLQTNSRTIDQLSLVPILGDNDYFEINGGKRVGFSYLKNLIDANMLESVTVSPDGEALALSILSHGGKSVRAVIPCATEELAGVMTAEQWKALNYLKQHAATKTELADLKRTGAATPRFSGIVTSVITDVTHKDFNMMSSEHRSTDAGCDVVFLQPLGIFALRVNPNAGLSPLSDEAHEAAGLIDPGVGVNPGDLELLIEYKYYANWVDAGELGLRFGKIGYEPVPGVLYECTSAPYGFVRFRVLGVESDYPQYEVVRVQMLGDSPDIEIAGNTAVLTEEASMRPFIALFNHAAGSDGKYDPENAPDAEHTFLLNKLWLTYAEAMDVLIHTAGLNAQHFGNYAGVTNYVVSGAPIRTNFAPTHYSNPSYESAFFGCGQIEVIRLKNGWPKSLTSAFYRCWKLREILGTITFNGSFTSTFVECYELQEFRISNVSNDMNLRWSPKLSYDTIAYLVDNATNSKTITITVHVDVFAKLIGDGFNEAAGALSAAELARWVELGERAYNKNITFATTV